MKKSPSNRKIKLFTLSALTLAMGSLLSFNSVYATDLEIYDNITTTGSASSSTGTSGGTWGLSSDYKPVLMITLNIGDGMGIEDGSFSADYGIANAANCAPPRYASRTLETRKLEFKDASGTQTIGEVSYEYELCQGKPTRVSVLKDAFLKFLANPNPKIAEYKQKLNIESSLTQISDFKMGLATNFSANGPNGGYIALPALEMTDANRLLLAKEIAKQSAENKGATPLPLTIAETMAYLSGSTTVAGNPIKLALPIGAVQKGVWKNCKDKNFVKEDLSGILAGCNQFANTGPTQDVALAPYKNNASYEIKEISNGPNRYYYAAPKQATYPHSGFGLSHSGSKVKAGDRYKTPLNDKNQCAASGIYMLSDGDVFDAPNNNSAYIESLNKALEYQRASARVSFGQIKSYFCAKASMKDEAVKKNALGNTSTLYTNWSCAGEMAKYARSHYTADGKIDTSKSFVVRDENNKQFYADIRFASIGYGGGLKSVVNARKVKKEVTLSGGKKATVDVYDCNSMSDARARNMCLLGERGYGYGEGGFYYVPPNDTEEITKSMMNFMFSLSKPPIAPPPGGDRNPVSTGSMTTPLDTLNPQQSHQYAYLPVLDPRSNETKLWYGNLKKYKIKDAQMYGANDNPVLKNRRGEFAANVYDLWNKSKTIDNAKPQLGGTFSQLFYPTAPERKLYIDSGNSLHTIRANTLDSDVSKVRPKDADTLKSQIQSFLQNRVNGNDTLGAVLHSIPKLVTYEAILKDGEISSRDDAILYGSMDGALHLVNDKTGEEYFSFVPNQLLSLQPNALIKGSTKKGQIPYGVDGPWNIYSQGYSIDGNKYKATQIFAFGGLRMGGSTYYSLNISNKTVPTFVYSVGSNYGEHLQDTTVTLAGMSSYATANDDEKRALARMGQSWAEPSVGYVRSGGKKVLVNFLAGGYDMGYERADFSPTSTSPAQGNALYMVRVGEEKTNASTYQTSIDTTHSGKLLWWLSNGSGSSASTSSSNLQSSKHTELFHSIVSQVRVLDRDGDGYTDHIYFTDLGGRVWRADLNNTATHDNFNVVRVVKVLDVSDQKSGSDTSPRFYERPLVTFTNEIDGTIMAMVTVGTGNRSLPITEKRTTPDAIYSFLDKDVAASRDALFSSNYVLKTQSLNVANLEQLRFTDQDKQIKMSMLSGHKQGWYYPLSKWSSGNGSMYATSGLKSFNEPDALAGYLFTTMFNPAVENTLTTTAPIASTATDSCSAPVQPTTKLIGATQRLLMCLPFGNCASKGIGSYAHVPVNDIGEGIINNNITQGGGKDEDFRTLNPPTCTGAGCKPAGLDPEDIRVSLKRILNPHGWWEK